MERVYIMLSLDGMLPVCVCVRVCVCVCGSKLNVHQQMNG